MTSISPLNADHRAAAAPDSARTAELREQFTQFVGEVFFGQMIKAMRATTGKPAYFHGGRGEEVFQSQLDQQLAQHLTKASAERFAEPMFERQFPRLAKSSQQSDFNGLAQLRRY
jgi:Rod binding domain-containing protein